MVEEDKKDIEARLEKLGHLNEALSPATMLYEIYLAENPDMQWGLGTFTSGVSPKSYFPIRNDDAVLGKDVYLKDVLDVLPGFFLGNGILVHNINDVIIFLENERAALPRPKTELLGPDGAGDLAAHLSHIDALRIYGELLDFLKNAHLRTINPGELSR